MRRVPGTSALIAQLLVTSLASASLARANEPIENRIAADALFDQGKLLLAEGNAAEACPKFVESQRLSPALGTLLNLAACWEQAGRTASAWSEFRAAAALARAKGQTEREQFAREYAADLEPKLARMTIAVSAASDIPGLTIRRNGVASGKPLWNTPVPLDPGSHLIEASAPGKQTWSTRFDVPPGPGAHVVAVPRLRDAVSAAPARWWTSGETQRLVAVGAGGLAVATIGAGTVFGIVALDKRADSSKNNHCDMESVCDPTGFSLRGEARDAANVATAMILVGTAVLAGSVALYLGSPSPAKGVAVRAFRLGAATGGAFAGAEGSF